MKDRPLKIDSKKKREVDTLETDKPEIPVKDKTTGVVEIAKI